MHTRMGKEPVGQLILKLAIPAMFSMLISALYNIVDMYFVSQINPAAVRGVSLAMPFVNIVIGVGVGTGVGLNSLVARRLGEKRFDEANRAAEHSIPLGIIWGIIFTLLAIFFTEPVSHLLTDQPDVAKYARQYGFIYLVGSFTILIQLNNEKLIQSTGNTFYPMLFGLLGTVVNIVLDPILIHGYLGFPKMEVIGAAVATIIGQGTAMVASIIALYSKTVGFKLNLRKFKLHLKTVKEIYAVGLPSIIMQTIGSVTIIIINSILNSFTGTAVNVLNFYFQLQSFVYMPVFGLTQGALPVMGYNYGAKLKDRFNEALVKTIIYALIIMIAGIIVFWVFPDKLLSIFLPPDAAADYVQEVLDIGIYALRVISLSFPMAAVNIVFSNYFQSTGKGLVSMIISLLRQVLIIIPMAFILSKVFGLSGIWFCYPIAEIVAFMATLSIFFFYFRHNVNEYMVDSLPV